MIVAAAGIRPGECVVEPGAGTGALTAALLAAGATVQAVEIDPRRLTALEQRFAAACTAGRLRLLPLDLRRIAAPHAGPWRLVGNPPFNCTAPLLRHLLLDELDGPRPQAIDLVLQQQAGRKWTGMPGAQTRSSVLARCCGEPRIGRRLPRGATTPPSHVPLALWHWRGDPAAPEPARCRALDRLCERGFAGPHSVRGALRSVSTPAILKRQAAAHGWDPAAHPRTLEPAAWIALADFLDQLGKI